MLKKCLVWFRNDLRFHDNEALLWAHENAELVIPVFCFDPRLFETTHRYKFPKTGNFRAQFLIQSVEDLRKTLKAKGSNLLIFNKRPEVILPSIYEKCKYDAVIFQKETTSEETDVEDACEQFCTKNNIQFRPIWGSTLYHKDDLPYTVKDCPDTYTQFRKDVESRSKIRKEQPMPPMLKPLPLETIEISEELPSLQKLGLVDPTVNANTAFPFSGGETHALSRLQSYLWSTRAVEKYKTTRNGLLGSEYSTKFSPWLAFGCISPRRIFFELRKYENERVKNDSTYWEALRKYGISGKKIWQNFANGQGFRFPQIDGQTGVPFVDANMRELLETGWMSNRGRQNVASFLTKDLKLDWRLGAEWFEYLLVDYDVCSNYGNWNYSAGIGNDPREDRKFNMIKQAMDYDSDGSFARIWVPELSSIHGGKIHVPWTLRHGELGSIKLGVDYPNPMIVAQEWGRHFDKTKSSSWTAPSRNKQKGIDFYFKSNTSSGR